MTEQQQANWNKAIDEAFAPHLAKAEYDEYNRDLALRIKNNQVGSGMKLR